jgi:hypothetical protein
MDPTFAVTTSTELQHMTAAQVVVLVQAFASAVPAGNIVAVTFQVQAEGAAPAARSAGVTVVGGSDDVVHDPHLPV